MTGAVTLTMKQLRRLDVVKKSIAGFITVKEAAEKLGLSERQVQRLKRKVEKEDAAALVHKNTLRKPSHAIPEEVKEKILKIRERPGYNASNFRHFQELLEEHHMVKISYSALYRLLVSEGIKSPKTRRRFKPHRRRKRKSQAGSLIQIDASPFDWLSTGIMLALHGAIDDATGQVTGLYLCRNECLIGYHEVLRRTINAFGVPEAAYTDKHTIFRSPNEDKRKREDTPKGTSINETQFGRAMRELGVQIITARSPQAKGRIERLWETLQSRLPVEFAIRGITDIEEANKFLESYIYAINSEFAVEPEDGESAFLPLDERLNLDYILCVKEERILDHGQVFSYKGKRLQIVQNDYSAYLPPKAKITVMVSPWIGIKAAYKNIIFETRVAPPKGTKGKPEKPREEKAKAPVNYGKHKTEPFVPKDGLPWRPGLESYRECKEIVEDIFFKPYSNKRPKGPGKERRSA
ncbi:MAG: ISNCY family transposase [Clostridiales Family XIII bacterium]|nr:ISNCY family transposase [Clostridiales Family XIII bacterium]